MLVRIRLVLSTILVAVYLVATGILTPSAVSADTPLQSGKQVLIYFFWSEVCPHCAVAKPFLEDLTRRYPNVQMRDYEIWNHAENRAPFDHMAEKFGFQARAVPTIFIGNRYWEGFNEQIAQELEAAVAACVSSGCPDAGQGVLPPLQTGLASEALSQPPGSPLPAPAQAVLGETTDNLNLPFLGPVNLASQSLPVSTALIAFVDGFNPCSLWVLSVLLAMTLHTGSRRKVFIIGMVFLAVTSLVYVLFIAGLFSIFSVVSFVGWIQVVVALVALFFALVNVKDYFWYKEGLSFTIADEKKPGIYRGIRRVMNAGDSMWGLISATVIMSAGVSLVEFSCTAGFPVVWTNLLVSQNVTIVTFVLLLLLYMIIYQIDEIGIFLAAVYSLRASKLEEKHGRILKLFGGMLMLTLAIVMLINPTLMHQLSTSVGVFAVAFAAALLVLLVHRKILPGFGIYIGTEIKPAKTPKHPRLKRA